MKEEGDAFIISIHALERFEERFPDVCACDDDIGQLIYRETMDALDAGRIASVPPLELSTYDLERWRASKAKVAWTAEKDRGYVLVTDQDGMTVKTVLVGQETSLARSRVYQTGKYKTLIDRQPSGSSPERIGEQT